MGEEMKLKERGKEKKKEEEIRIGKEQTKFFVDLRKDKEGLGIVKDFLAKCNQKSYGRPVTFRELSLFAIGKLVPKDIEKIQEASLTEMEKVNRMLDDYNSKNGTTLDLGGFLIKKLNIT